MKWHVEDEMFNDVIKNIQSARKGIEKIRKNTTRDLKTALHTGELIDDDGSTEAMDAYIDYLCSVELKLRDTVSDLRDAFALFAEIADTLEARSDIIRRLWKAEAEREELIAERQRLEAEREEYYTELRRAEAEEIQDRENGWKLAWLNSNDSESACS